MAILKVKDENGNIIEIPAIQGKSAYEYAKDGGYTGTEEQFASKLATEYLKSGYEQYLYTGNTYNIQLELGGMFLVSFYSGYNVGALYLVQTGDIEKHHEERYMTLVGNIENDLVFQKGEEKIWICRNCGHIYRGTKALELCPVCKHPKAYMEVKSETYM